MQECDFMKVGDTAYIVESNRYVREVEIRRCSGGMFLVRFTDTGGGIRNTGEGSQAVCDEGRG